MAEQDKIQIDPENYLTHLGMIFRESARTRLVRTEDILDAMNREKTTGAASTISQAALDRICEHDWPGNVRELENLIERLVILRGEGEIEVDDLPHTFRQRPATLHAGAPRIPAGGLPFNEVVDRFEADLILQALEQTHWNKNRAAQLLGLNRTTLIEKIKKKRLSADDE